MSTDEFSELKGMVKKLGEKVEELTTAIYEYKLEISQKLAGFDNRITKIEQRCDDQNNTNRRFIDNIFKAIPIGLTMVTLFIIVWDRLKRG